MMNEFFELSNGLKIPKVGLGTWLIDNDKVEEVVECALEAGYRHIDTAQAYGNEEGVGKAIRKSNIARQDLFITSKIAAEAKTYQEAYDSINETLNKMGLDYLDLMIIHSPQPWQEFRDDNRYFKENKEVWKALETAYQEGKVKAIGVSNFLKDDLENILTSCQIKPMVNQILTHISNTKTELIKFCKENDILVEAYSPIAHGAILKNENIIAMANKYNVSVARLCIRYIIQLGLVALPKASSKEHLIDNLKVDFEISEEDMEVLKAIKTIEDYGQDDFFPVFSAKDQKDNR
ncbi:2,5-diketo-D-gluconic acid reductase [Thomasclavelia spiroformis]|uniref:2,5-diketo-D-gluconic acid reductase n=2 Tax=Thomasclavelia spiroformis TaxID=29348 RepID=A0A1Y4QDU0_9FIRM|nr:aldo/keto reductase [Thomasclavelia spiroformis]MBS6685818.1 aldo/keto reductase [Thomasclavelia spiroformis]OUQ03387.1 2,5-diketo-D-gluconic acid reductase [Thomasclavelia spiroformis]